MKEPTILPCPFCGGVGEVCVGEHAFSDAKVRCRKCGAEGPLFNDFAKITRNERAAVNAWNERVHPPAYQP